VSLICTALAKQFQAGRGWASTGRTFGRSTQGGIRASQAAAGEMFLGNDRSRQAWLEEAIAALEGEAGK